MFISIGSSSGTRSLGPAGVCVIARCHVASPRSSLEGGWRVLFGPGGIRTIGIGCEFRAFMRIATGRSSLFGVGGSLIGPTTARWRVVASLNARLQWLWSSPSLRWPIARRSPFPFWVFTTPRPSPIWGSPRDQIGWFWPAGLQWTFRTLGSVRWGLIVAFLVFMTGLHIRPTCRIDQATFGTSIKVRSVFMNDFATFLWLVTYLDVKIISRGKLYCIWTE